MDFLTPMDVRMSEGRWADSPGPNWGTGYLITCEILLLDVQEWNAAPPQVFPKFQSLRCTRPFPLSHIHIPRHTQKHTHTHTQPLANSLKRVTFVPQLPVKRGEHCLWVNKVKVTDQVNLREQGFYFLGTFLLTPNMFPAARRDNSGTYWLMVWPQVKKSYALYSFQTLQTHIWFHWSLTLTCC